MAALEHKEQDKHRREIDSRYPPKGRLGFIPLAALVK